MKKTILLCAVAMLCACTANMKNINAVSDSVWTLDPMEKCAQLIEQNKTALEQIRKNYSADIAEQAASLYQELDLQTNAVCRSRIPAQMQNEKIQELRTEYIGKVNALLAGK